jgi:hypothetical protein
MRSTPGKGRGRSVLLCQQTGQGLKHVLLNVIVFSGALNGKSTLQEAEEIEVVTGRRDGRRRQALDIPWGDKKALLAAAAKLRRKKTEGSPSLQTAIANRPNRPASTKLRIPEHSAEVFKTARRSCSSAAYQPRPMTGQKGRPHLRWRGSAATTLRKGWHRHAAHHRGPALPPRTNPVP